MPNFQLPSCQQNGWELNADFVEFTELNNTNWPFNDYELQTGPQVDKEMCKEFCLRDCFCAAAIYNGKDQCWKKRFPLSNGIQSASVNGIALIKVPRKNETTLCPKSKDRSTLVLAISVLLGSSVFFNFLLLISISVAIFFLYHKKMLNLRPASTLYGIRWYTYKELEEATGSFKQQLGRGSFGTVYKGVNPSNPMRYIAIKRLDMAVNEGENEFTTEVNVIGQTHHKNLVNLLGYCDEGNNRPSLQHIKASVEPTTANCIRGTVGYFAPEWFRKAWITLKVDVYSFGVMLLEIVCCMSSVKFGMEDDEEEGLVDWIYECYSEEKLEMLVEDDEEARNDMKGVTRVVMVGIWCIQEDPSLRPSMRRVTQMLEGSPKFPTLRALRFLLHHHHDVLRASLKCVVDQ
ncbi:UNVERIFIED_CONTAM: G-type lectin S-receptor-like serine/threonine-protein kinase LECRK4 [Sesamum angustifolium]|uniref:non-specific serine/threonine protein kinase n=1 Tax=Sesamum angustifolium TaxID=2727405 RepID=A0AAW2QR80_9LAMI